MAISRSARCDLCYEEMWGECYKQEDDKWYCHNPDWIIEEGTCWEQRVCEDFPEFVEWLAWGFECAGCEGDENGECICVNESFLDP